MAVIELEQVTKTYTGKSGQVQALKDVSLSVEEGEIYGVIGLSGAGKSTLVRCINLLEQPESGRIRVGGKELLSLSGPELRKERSFQEKNNIIIFEIKNPCNFFSYLIV